MFGMTKKTVTAPPAPAQSYIDLNEHKIHTQIAPDVLFAGDISLAQSGLICHGQIIGSVEAATTVVVMQGAKIEGAIKAPFVLCYGTVIGGIDAAKIEVHSTAHVEGSLRYEELDIAKGATVGGTLSRVPVPVAEVAQFPEHAPRFASV